MTTITQAFVNQIADLTTAGKTPWLTIADGAVTGVYKNRDTARAAKTGGAYKYDPQLGYDLVADEATDKPLPTGEAVADAMGHTAPVDNDASEFAAAKAAGPLPDTLTVTPVPPVEPAKVLAADKPKADILHKSTPVRPTKLVWQVADDMKAENPAVTRKEVLARCEEMGIAYFTARTQYQVWKQMQANA